MTFIAAPSPDMPDVSSGRPAEMARFLPDFLRVARTITLRGEPLLVTSLRYEYDDALDRDQLLISFAGAKHVAAFFANENMPSRTLYWEGNLSRMRGEPRFDFTDSSAPEENDRIIMAEVSVSTTDLLPKAIRQSGILKTISGIALGQAAVIVEDGQQVKAGLSVLAINPSQDRKTPNRPVIIMECFVDRKTSVGNVAVSAANLAP